MGGVDGAVEAGENGAADGVPPGLTNVAVADLAQGAVVGAADGGVDGMEEGMVAGSLRTVEGVHCGVALCTCPVRFIKSLTNPQHIM